MRQELTLLHYTDPFPHVAQGHAGVQKAYSRASVRMAVEILIVEDNPGDVGLIRQALSERTVPVRITVAGDGESALKVLEALPPDLILVDFSPLASNSESLTRFGAEAILPAVIVFFPNQGKRPSHFNQPADMGRRRKDSQPV
jgi:hypothetical protein